MFDEPKMNTAAVSHRIASHRIAHACRIIYILRVSQEPNKRQRASRCSVPSDHCCPTTRNHLVCASFSYPSPPPVACRSNVEDFGEESNMRWGGEGEGGGEGGRSCIAAVLSLRFTLRCKSLRWIVRPIAKEGGGERLKAEREEDLKWNINKIYICI